MKNKVVIELFIFHYHVHSFMHLISGLWQLAFLFGVISVQKLAITLIMKG